MRLRRGTLEVATTADGTDECFIRRLDSDGGVDVQLEVQSGDELRWLALTALPDACRDLGRGR